jgi:transglutaminase-like putative cysteine protease
MSKIIAINHVTHYQYDRPIRLEPQMIRLRPAPHTRTRIQSYSLSIFPEKYFINWQQDPFANYIARVALPEKAREFRVEVDLVVEIKVFNPFDFFVEESAKSFPLHYSDALKNELLPYLEIKERSPKLLDFIQAIDKKPQDIIQFLVLMNTTLHHFLNYQIRLEPGIQSCEETLTLKNGSCRDMAWLLCQILRHMGLASRFVSGYLIQLKADIKSLVGRKSTYQAQDGSGLIRLLVFLRVKVIFPCVAHRIHQVLHRLAVILNHVIAR